MTRGTFAVLLMAPVILLQHQSYLAAQMPRTGKSISVSFEGGTVRSYVDHLKLRDSNVQVVVTENAANLTLPKIKVDGIPPRQAVSLIEHLGPNPPRLRVTPLGDVGSPVRPNDQVQVLIVGADPVKESDRKLTIVNLGQLIRSDPNPSRKEKGRHDAYDMFVKAVTVGLELIGSESSNVTMKIHKESGLFFFVGTREECDVVTQVADKLAEAQPLGKPTYSLPYSTR